MKRWVYRRPFFARTRRWLKTWFTPPSTGPAEVPPPTYSTRNAFDSSYVRVAESGSSYARVAQSGSAFPRIAASGWRAN